MRHILRNLGLINTEIEVASLEDKNIDVGCSDDSIVNLVFRKVEQYFL